ncbi:MAG: PorV/PorQ family protein [Ignavibacteriales bacterium]|nr:PorV/PorQ family protein [Ignavibacteriales bacterium]
MLTLFTTPLLFAGAGQTGLSFLKLGVGARALGMGEACAAVAADPTAMYYNPAGIAHAKTSQLTLMHKEWIQGVKTEYLAAMISATDVSVGLSLNATSVNDIELRAIPGAPLGTFSARNAAMGISAAYAFDPSFSIGVTGKYLYEKILVDEASGIAFDLGSSYQTPWDVRLALAVTNLGSVNELHDQASALPRSVRAGGAYETKLESLDGIVTLAADVVSLTGEGITHVNLGTEFAYKKLFAFRVGYQTGFEARNISAGVGVRQGLFQVDYAFVPFRYDLGTTHTFSLNIEFP